MKYAAKRCTAQQINELIKSIREGQPPQLPERQREERYYDSALPGFYILLLNTGVARWVVQYKRLARQKKIRLGDVNVLDRKDAIDAGRKLLAKVTLDMLDPLEARRERMRANKVTFIPLAPLFLERKKSSGELKPNSYRKWYRSLTDYYFKPLHNLPIDEITTEQIQTRVDFVTGQSGNGAAIECCTAMRAFFKWAIKTKKLPPGHHNPMDGVQPPAANAGRDRVLTDDEIRLIWKTCESWEAQAVQDQQLLKTMGKRLPGRAPSEPDAPRAIKLLFLTGCRRQEIGELRWPEVDLDKAELFIPGSRRKSRKSKEQEQNLCVPLADMAVQILRGVARRPNNDQVFGRGRRQVSGLDLGGTYKRINKRIVKAGMTPPLGWTLHDIRRTFRTRLAELGVTSDVAEALVGHVGHRTEMDRIYNRYKYWPEKRRAMAKWEDELRAIIDDTVKKIDTPQFGGRRKGGTG